MARITTRDLLLEVRALGQRIDARFDGLDARVDTMIDSIADLRRDLATHRHDD